MTDASGFAFLAGGAIGFLIGLIAAARCMADEDKRRVQNGIMEVKGIVYRVMRINP